MKSNRTCPCEGHTLDRLLPPTVMSLLSEGPLHGYALIEKSKLSPLLNGSTPDPSGMYRILTALEGHGLVSHGWCEPGEGPAKRIYELTPSGRKCLRRWIDTLDEYQKNIGRLVRIMRKTKRAKKL